MALNCRVGDFAVIVRARCAQNQWRIVEVVGVAAPNEIVSGFQFTPTLPGPYWRIRGRIALDDWITIEEFCCADSQLRPIRPNDGEDEILRIAGKPIKETA